jgi:putative ABC transport system substrate-binding protein
MRRREFITFLGGAAAIWSTTARAQQSAMPVVGFLSSRSPGESSELVAAFRTGLRQMGFVEGQNAIIAFRWAEGRYERLAELASDLVNLHVAVLLAAGGAPSALAAKTATSTVPIVFLASNPIDLGLVSSLNQPGGNLTGISNVATELPGKSLGLLKQTVPSAEAMGYLVNTSSPSAKSFLKEARDAARTLATKLHVVEASTSAELEDAFTTLEKLHVGVLAVMADPFFDTQSTRVAELSARHRIAGCYPWRQYVVAGGLMSYGANAADQYRQAGIYTARILQGESPSSLPVMEPVNSSSSSILRPQKRLGSPYRLAFFPLPMR